MTAPDAPPRQRQPPIIAIAGPTAAGKSAFALALTEAMRGEGHDAELVSVDSAQIYRGMDIGSAKPDSATQAQVRHHLIDILDPVEPYSAARFAADARAAIAAIRSRGHRPVLVGGTMLYYKALFEGLSELPPADAALRVTLEAEAARDGAEAQHARLMRIDPQTAARLHPNDAQRVQRALEIHALSGEPPSVWYARPKAASILGPVIRRAIMSPDREVLNLRIAQRFQAMMAQGFVEEVARLKARGDLNIALPAMRAVGYRQIWGYLDGQYDRAEAVRLGIIATRQYAKRQMTWLRRDTAWRALDPAEPGAVQQVLKEAALAPLP